MANPIEHVVIIVKVNHTFDNYFGTFPGAAGVTLHASIVKFCLRLFGLRAWNAPALQPADRSGDMWESFDFAAAPRLGVPSPAPT